MTISSSDRLGITRWSDPADDYTRAQRDGDNAIIDDLVAIDAQGPAADRPAADTRGAWWHDTDSGRLYRDNGTAWVEVITAGTTITQVKLGAAARALGVDARITASADVTSRELAILVRHGDQAAGDPVVTLGNPSLAERDLVIDADGSIRTGRPGASTPAQIPRQGFLTIRPDDLTERCLVIDSPGPGGLTADLIRANTDGTRRFTVDALGRVFLSALSDNAAPPTPTGAGVLYCNTTGDLVYKGPSGTVTTLASH